MLGVKNLNLIYQTTRCAFLAHEKNSFLGMFWHLLNPLAMSLVLYVVFSNVGFFANVDHYPVFILIGVINFNFFSQATVRAADGMIHARSLILNTTIPRETLIWRSVALDGLTYLIELVLVLGFVVVFADGLSVAAFGYIFVMLGILMLTLGTAFLIGASVVFLSDLTYVWNVTMRMLFFATPIFYSVTMIENAWARALISLNPLARLIEMARQSLLVGQALSPSEVALGLVGPALVLGVGVWVFQSLKNGIPDVI